MGDTALALTVNIAASAISSQQLPSHCRGVTDKVRHLSFSCTLPD